MLKNLAHRLLASRGYELKQIGAPLKGFEVFLEHCKTDGLSPTTVFDGGVGRGTPWLYAAFPNAKHVLIEPLDIFADDIAAIGQTYDVDFHQVALGEAAGEIAMDVRNDFPTSSSILPYVASMKAQFRTESKALEQSCVTVEVRPLDSYASYAGPYVVKLDLEGYELNALRGAQQILASTELLIVEVSLL